MNTATRARQLEADDVGFVEGQHHPCPTVLPPTSFFDDPRDRLDEDAVDRMAMEYAITLARGWIGACCADADHLVCAAEAGRRVHALDRILSAAPVSLAKIEAETRIPHTSLHRKIVLICGRTGLPSPFSKKKTATAPTGTVSEKSMTTTYEEGPFDE